MRSVKIKIMDEIIGQAKDIKLMVPDRIHPVIYKTERWPEIQLPV